MRGPSDRLAPSVTGVIVLLLTLGLAALVGAVLRMRSGRLRPAGRLRPSDRTAAGADPAVDADPGLAADLARLGLEPGERATFLQFSSTFCASCRATRTLLAAVAGSVPGVRHHEVDVADGGPEWAALDLVRRLGILRTPTTLVLDASAREVRRASGVPRRDQLLTALGTALEPASDTVGDDAGSVR
jgi:thiol-disulfide isomerase/thioredoxin